MPYTLIALVTVTPFIYHSGVTVISPSAFLNKYNYLLEEKKEI
jgi:hypothetical protein